jgi:hypothetical protein
MAPTPAHPFDHLSPSQRALLRIVCWVAWADGDFAPEERQLLNTVVARSFASDPGASRSAELVEALTSEHLQGADPAALVADLADADTRQLAVKLALQMVSIQQRPTDTEPVNPQEKQAYRRLIEALGLPENEVEQAEWAARQELQHKRGPLDILAAAFAGQGAWPSPQELDPQLPLGYWL